MCRHSCSPVFTDSVALTSRTGWRRNGYSHPVCRGVPIDDLFSLSLTYVFVLDGFERDLNLRISDRSRDPTTAGALSALGSGLLPRIWRWAVSRGEDDLIETLLDDL